MKLHRGLNSIAVVLLAALLGGCNGNVAINESLRVAEGEIHKGSLSTVNGNIYIGEKSRVYGECHSVNGRIEIGAGAEIRDIATVNGDIYGGENVLINGKITSVNGGVYLSAGTEVTDEITTVNGKVELLNCVVNGDVVTLNGNMEITDGTVVKGNLIIESSRGNSSGRANIKIRIENNAVVEGGVLVQDPAARVVVYLSGGGRVQGEIKNAEVLTE